MLYGSGYVLLAFLRSDFVLRLGWITDQQLLDAVAIGQVTPGPLFTAATCLKVMKLCQEVVEKGNPNAISDAVVGALLVDAALWGGMFNVLINLSALEDKKCVQQMWLHGIYMADVFHAQPAGVLNRPHYYDDVAKQIELVYNATKSGAGSKRGG